MKDNTRYYSKIDAEDRKTVYYSKLDSPESFPKIRRVWVGHPAIARFIVWMVRKLTRQRFYE